MKAKKVENEGLTTTISGISQSSCNLNGNNDKSVAAASSSQIFASDNNLDGTWAIGAPCYKDNNDSHKAGEVDNYFFLTLLQDAPCYKDGNDDHDEEVAKDSFFSMTSSHDEFLKISVHHAASMCEGMKMN